MDKRNSSSASDAVQCVYVISDIDGFKYKLVMEGDVRLLTGDKIKRYLQKATGLAPEHQALTLDGRPVPDGACGGDLDLRAGAAFRLQHSGRAMGHNNTQDNTHNNTQNNTRNSAQDNTWSSAQDNARLVERLADAERRLANAQPDWRLEEEAQTLRTAVARLERERDDAQRAAEALWHAKEEELVRELDLMREERRRARLEQEQRAEEQRVVVLALEGQIRALQAELAAQQKQQQQQQQEQEQQQYKEQKREGGGVCVAAAVRANLSALSRALGIVPPLQLDANDTCAVPVGPDGLSVLVTLDEASARVFLYATIASALPTAPGARLRLYEALLKGALLGRDTGGAGVGVCRESGLVIMSTAVDMTHADEEALAAVAQPFIAAAQRWVNRVAAMAAEEM